MGHVIRKDDGYVRRRVMGIEMEKKEEERKTKEVGGLCESNI